MNQVAQNVLVYHFVGKIIFSNMTGFIAAK